MSARTIHQVLRTIGAGECSGAAIWFAAQAVRLYPYAILGPDMCVSMVFVMLAATCLVLGLAIYAA